MIRIIICFLSILALTPVFAASEGALPLKAFKLDLNDKPSLQRGAKIYMNYCSGCHSLKYVRYTDMAQDLGIVDEDGKILEDVIEKNLMFFGEKISDTIGVSMPKDLSAHWFGVAPPDLSLVSRSRGLDWIYSYLLSFYKDPTRPWGVNNTVFPAASMPHVLERLQGLQTALVENGRITGLRLERPGLQSVDEYEQTVRDVVNFLAYVGEPALMHRKRTGVWVLLFLAVFIVFAVLLKKEYWKDIK
ncbi:MAG: cytochrome c1 [Gammaproteobacteria bacterium]